jgi:hypothetical protein
MGTTDKPAGASANSPSQSGQSQTKPQSPPQSSPQQQKPSSGQQSQGQQKPGSTGNQNPRDNNPSGNRSAQSGAERVGSVAQGNDPMNDDEPEIESNKSPGASDRNRSDRDRTQVR